MVAAIVAPDEAWRGDTTALATAAELIVAAWPALAIDEECPYRGLEPFTANDTRFYFGRREEIDRVLARLDASPPVIAIFGPSGSGKSSLVHAGVIPHLDAARWVAPDPVRRYDDIDARSMR